MLNKKELKQFGNFVHSKRMELGRAALPFLRDLGITLSYFHNLLEIENGEREPTLIFVNKLIALCKKNNLSIDIDLISRISKARLENASSIEKSPKKTEVLREYIGDSVFNGDSKFKSCGDVLLKIIESLKTTDEGIASMMGVSLNDIHEIMSGNLDKLDSPFIKSISYMCKGTGAFTQEMKDFLVSEVRKHKSKISGLAFVREKIGLTQAELASVVGMDQKTIDKIERGVSPLRLHEALIIRLILLTGLLNSDGNYLSDDDLDMIIPFNEYHSVMNTDKSSEIIKKAIERKYK